jgi:hypothetical protein
MTLCFFIVTAFLIIAFFNDFLQTSFSLIQKIFSEDNNINIGFASDVEVFGVQ